MPTIRATYSNSKHYHHHHHSNHNRTYRKAAYQTLHFVTAVTPSDKSMTTAFINEANSYVEAEIMIDSGAATHVCPPWFAQKLTPLHTPTRTGAEFKNSNR